MFSWDCTKESARLKTRKGKNDAHLQSTTARHCFVSVECVARFGAEHALDGGLDSRDARAAANYLYGVNVFGLQL